MTTEWPAGMSQPSNGQKCIWPLKGQANSRYLATETVLQSGKIAGDAWGTNPSGDGRFSIVGARCGIGNLAADRRRRTVRPSLGLIADGVRLWCPADPSQCCVAMPLDRAGSLRFECLPPLGANTCPNSSLYRRRFASSQALANLVFAGRFSTDHSNRRPSIDRRTPGMAAERDFHSSAAGSARAMVASPSNEPRTCIGRLALSHGENAKGSDQHAVRRPWPEAPLRLATAFSSSYALRRAEVVWNPR